MLLGDGKSQAYIRSYLFYHHPLWENMIAPADIKEKVGKNVRHILIKPHRLKSHVKFSHWKINASIQVRSLVHRPRILCNQVNSHCRLGHCGRPGRMYGKPCAFVDFITKEIMQAHFSWFRYCVNMATTIDLLWIADKRWKKKKRKRNQHIETLNRKSDQNVCIRFFLKKRRF